MLNTTQLKALFRKVVFLFHPDRIRQQENLEQFKTYTQEINNARDEQTLKKYAQVAIQKGLASIFDFSDFFTAEELGLATPPDNLKTGKPSHPRYPERKNDEYVKSDEYPDSENNEENISETTENDTSQTHGLWQFIQCMISALNEEIRAVRVKMKMNQIPEEIGFEGTKFLQETMDGFVYQIFSQELLDLEFPIPEGASVYYPNENIFGTVETCNLKNMYIDIEFKDEIIGNAGKLIFDSTAPLEQLKQKLSKYSPDSVNKNAIFNKIFSFNPDNPKNHFTVNKQSFEPSTSLDVYQVEAIKTILGSSYTFLWGPPGTGKTATLAELIAAYKKQHKHHKIWITSHTHIAVDTLMNRIQPHTEYKSYRLGIPSLPLKQHIYDRDSFLLHVLQDTYDLQEIYDLCEELQIQLSIPFKKPTQFYGYLLKCYFKLRNEKWVFKDLYIKVANILGKLNAILQDYKTYFDIVGSTISKCFMGTGEDISDFDLIVIDEMSTINLAMLSFIFLSIKRGAKLCIAGDFNQLPPIVQSNDTLTKKYLGTDLFTFIGLADPELDEETLPCRPILRTQYRMHPDICGLINQLFYSGKLITDTKSLLKPLNESSTAHIRGPLLFLDTMGLSKAYHAKTSYSLYNPKHIALIQKIVTQYAPILTQETMSIIVPYREQKRQLRRIIPELKLPFDLFINTIHAFQGQESDIILLDLVDAPGAGPGMLRSTNSFLNNMLNVAISRAKKQLIVLLNTQDFKSTHTTVFSLTHQLNKWGNKCLCTTPDNLDSDDFIKTITTFASMVKIMTTRRLRTRAEIKTIIASPEIKNLYYKNKSMFILEQQDELNNDLVTVKTEGKKISIPVYEIEAVKKNKQWYKLIATQEAFYINKIYKDIPEYV